MKWILMSYLWKHSDLEWRKIEKNFSEYIRKILACRGFFICQNGENFLSAKSQICFQEENFIHCEQEMRC